MNKCCLVTLLACLVCSPAGAQTTDELVNDGRNTQNVTTQSMGYARQSFSPLNQINTKTVKRLVPVWSTSLMNDMGELAAPTVYNGVMYVINGKWTFAIDVATGRQLWRTPVELEPGIQRSAITRGAATIYNGKVFRVTIDNHVLALDMKTGKQIWNQKFADASEGYYATSALAIVGFFISAKSLLAVDAVAHPEATSAWLYFFFCGVIGILMAQAFVYITQYYTESKYRPVKAIAEASQTGPATNIIAGVAVGLECTAIPVVVISIAIIASYYLGGMSGVPHAGLFGTAVATMGMLGTAAYILAMDTFGPITDNAGGIIEMSGQPEEVRRKTDRLDAVGNTTKALTKGYAIGSAALAAFLLFSAYMDEVHHYGTKLEGINIAKPEVFVGGLLGATLVFLFSALAIRAVGKAAYYVINEVRRQFKENPGILQGTSKPDYARCVDIVTVGALKEMILPGLIAVGTPIAVGLVFRILGVGAEAVGALLMVGTIAGILMATFLNNSGGAWDNAKKFIEAGAYGGKGSETHKAAVVGDTVGDPFKDTAGPSLHVLIKLLATITLVLAPLFV